MKFLSDILRIYDINLQPPNSVYIDIQSAKILLYLGAHIATANPYEHFHHGIVVNLTETDISVIHFWGLKKREARIQTTTLPIFIAGGIKKLGNRTRHLYLVNYQKDTPEKQQETSHRAKDMLNKPDSYKYNLLRLNCESFAYFCRTDIWESEQVKILRHSLADKTKQIYEKIKDAKERHVDDVVSLFKAMPADVLSSTERDNLKELCQGYALSV